jgi:hypothetical protein
VTTFKLGRRPFLLAVGDGVQLLVSRSLVVSTELDPDYRRVADYIAEHRMVLVDREVGPEAGMYGSVEQSHYAVPDARNLLMQFPEEN